MAVSPAAVDLVTARFVLSGSLAILVAPFVFGVLADGAGISAAFGITVPLLLAAFVVTTRLCRRSP
jgi:hypothetical protein